MSQETDCIDIYMSINTSISMLAYFWPMDVASRHGEHHFRVAVALLLLFLLHAFLLPFLFGYKLSP